MPSWDYDGREIPVVPEFDPDAVEVPEPYTEAEWAETEGARQPDGQTWLGGQTRNFGPDYPTHFERVKDAGYEPGDPKGYSVP